MHGRDDVDVSKQRPQLEASGTDADGDVFFAFSLPECINTHKSFQKSQIALPTCKPPRMMLKKWNNSRFVTPFYDHLYCPAYSRRRHRYLSPRVRKLSNLFGGLTRPIHVLQSQ